MYDKDGEFSPFKNYFYFNPRLPILANTSLRLS